MLTVWRLDIGYVPPRRFKVKGPVASWQRGWNDQDVSGHCSRRRASFKSLILEKCRLSDDSISRFYRGIGPPILVEAPKRALKFSAAEEWGKFYRKAFGRTSMDQSLSILTGASAGATEALVVVMPELVKIRLQDRASVGRYKGPWDVIVQVVRNEGIVGLANGLESTVWRQ
jgi:Mitochondrial carrier protein